MKKFSFFLLALLFAFPSYAWDTDPQQNVIPIMSGNTVATNGTSTYIIDLNSPQFALRPTGDFSLQFQGLITDAGLYNAGTTINATWSATNTLPSGTSIYTGLLPGTGSIASKLASTSIVSGLNVVSGNTEYVYGFFFIDVARYLILNITSGITNTGVTCFVKVD